MPLVRLNLPCPARSLPAKAARQTAPRDTSWRSSASIAARPIARRLVCREIASAARVAANAVRPHRAIGSVSQVGPGDGGCSIG
eukprot:363974-Chlamydomonas_euryale.AAC.10